VNWVLDADLRKFFDSVDHEWLLRMIAHRITDPRILRLIDQWLKAGVMESGKWFETTEGTPQGSGISPLLANLFLHYAFDLWMARTHPDLPWCRYADDGLVHCRTEQEAEAVKAALQARLAECQLELHPTKTKIV
jgi:group II intron reverse transcriptase/maturase